MLDSPRGKNESTCRSGEGGGGPAIDPGSESLLGGHYWEGAREWCGDNKWDEEKKMLQRYIIITTSK